MASSVIGIMTRTNLTSKFFSHYTRLIIHPKLVNQRYMVTEEVKDKKSDAQINEQTQAEEAFNQQIETLNGEIKQLKDKSDELLDKYKRSLADNENLRTRLTKQIEDAKIFGIQGFCKDLIEVADILESATQSVPKDEVTDKNPHLKNLYEGLQMTTQSLHKVFARNGLEQINPLKEPFDPNFHEALFQKEDSSVGPNIVVEVTKKGYKLHGRCIKPALVGVSKA